MPQTEALYFSSLANDPDLSDLVTMYVDEMPERIAKVLDCLERGNWTDLHRVAHQIKGAAGSYGFEPISEFARRVEMAARSGQAEENIRQLTDELLDACRRVRPGAGE